LDRQTGRLHRKSKIIESVKILFITPSYKPAFVYGGPTMSVSQLCQALVEIGENVTVYTTTANGKEELKVEPGALQLVAGVPVIYFRRITKDHSHFSPALLWRVFMDCKKFDVVHVQSWWNLVAILGVFICWIRGVRPVLSPRGMLSDYSFGHKNSGAKLLFHKVVGKFLLSKTVLHATSLMEDRECKSILPQWTSFVLPNFVNIVANNAIIFPNKDLAVFKIGFLSRIDRKKGLELLLEALSGIEVPFELSVAGSGEASYLEELKALCVKLKIQSRIRWVGWLEGDEKFAFLRSIDLFVLTSLNENFANVVVEALSSGTPVLLSDHVGLADFVKKEEIGWVAALTVSDIRQAILNAVHADKQRLEIKSRGPKIALHHFTGNFLARKYSDHYHNFTAQTIK
jgi:glycosyltransferase involved in cell wall biosynthesis